MLKRLFDPKNILARGLGFLLGYSVLAALFNYLTTLQPKRAAGPGELPVWVTLVGWTIILLWFVPPYWSLVHSVRHWGWSLDEWGFSLKGRAWLSIGLALVCLSVVWLSVLPIELGNVRTADWGVGAMFAQAGIPLLVFEGYARVAEELLYRGFALVLFRRIFARSRLGSLWAILFSSALFALVHTHKPAAMLQLFIGAAVPLAAVTLWTRSISLALVTHAIAGGGHVGALYAAIFFTGVAIYNMRRK